MEERINKFLGAYENRLIWKFNDDINKNRKFMYGTNDELDETFFIFYKKNDKYFIDIGCCFEYGDFDYGRFDFFGYDFEITRKIKLEPDIYRSLLRELDLNNCIFGTCIDDYKILNEDDSKVKQAVKKTNDALLAQRQIELSFAKDNEKEVSTRQRMASSPEEKRKVDDELKTAKETVKSKTDLLKAAQQQSQSS